MSRLEDWRTRVIGDTSGPEWNRHLFQWERSNHVVWALVLFFGMLFGGTFLTLLIGSALHLQDVGRDWLRAVFMSAFLFAWFSFMKPVRLAIVVGFAFFAAQTADLLFRQAVMDAWPANFVSLAVALVSSGAVVRSFNLLDRRRARLA